MMFTDLHWICDTFTPIFPLLAWIVKIPIDTFLLLVKSFRNICCPIIPQIFNLKSFLQPSIGIESTTFRILSTKLCDEVKRTADFLNISTHRIHLWGEVEALFNLGNPLLHDCTLNSSQLDLTWNLLVTAYFIHSGTSPLKLSWENWSI